MSRPIALWVAPVADLAGVARHVLDAARAGLPGWRMVVLCPEGALAEELRRLGTAVTTGPFGPAVPLATSLATLRSTIGALRPQIVHSHLAYADIAVAIATAGLPTRLVTTEHGIAARGQGDVYHGNRAKSTLMAAVHAARLRRFDAAIAVSHATAEAMREDWHPRRPPIVIYNGVDRPAELPRRSPGLRIASIARLAPEKRIDVLVEAFALLAAGYDEARLSIAGDGPLKAELEAQVDRLGLAERVTFLGHRPAAEVLASSDVLAQVSRSENTSYSLLDAVTYGLGVCASAVGGNPEILPPRCLVTDVNAADTAELIREQGLQVDQRPALPDSWPTVAEMTAAIVEVYGGSR